MRTIYHKTGVDRGIAAGGSAFAARSESPRYPKSDRATLTTTPFPSLPGHKEAAIVTVIDR
jgi:hypothetical protein